MTDTGRAWPFVGRRAVLDQVALLMADRAGEPAFVIVEGEPGIGKTRLLAEICEQARTGGWTVRTGCATEYERGMPFALVYDAFPAALAKSTDGFGPDLASGVERHRRYRAARDELVDNASGGGGLLLGLDDVQWADPASQELLEYIVRHPPAAVIVIVLACRTGQCPPPLQRELGRAVGDVHWLRLEPLQDTDIDELFPTRSAARRRLLHRVSGGHPFYLEILSEAPIATLTRIAEAPDELDDRVAVAVDRAIAADLRTLDGVGRKVAQAAALLGGDLDLDLLAWVAEVEPDVAAMAVDRLVERDVLRERDGTVSFRHPLVRAAAYRTSGPGWRIRAHKRAADYLARCDASPTRRAPHLEHAASPGDERAAEELADAARSVVGTAPATSVRWARAALRVLPDGPAFAERRWDLRLQLAKALVLSGQLSDCESELRDLRDCTNQARTSAIRLTAMTMRLLGRPHEASGLARVELARTSDTWAQTMLQFELAVGELLTLRWEEGARVASSLVRTTADRHPGVKAAAAVVDALGPVSSSSLHELLGRLERARMLVDNLDDRSLRDVIQVVIPLAWTELFVDQAGHALRHLDRGMRLAHRYARVYLLPQLHPIRAIALGLVGRIGESLHEAENAEETARAVGSTEMVAFALSVGLQPLWWRYGPEAASAAMAKLEHVGPVSTDWYRLVADLLVADVALGLGRTAECQQRMLAWLAEDAVRLGLTPNSYVLLGRARLADGDVVGARGWLDEARAAAFEAPLASSSGSVALADVEILLAEDRAAEAVPQARSAVEHLEACGHSIRASQARVTLAEALLQDGQADDARHELGRAKEELADAGADWLSDQADRAQRRLGARLPRIKQPGVVSTALTTREREITELVAKRLTNREIAEQLYLSPRTVDAHVARIFNKLGISSRTAVARHLTIGRLVAHHNR